MRHSAAGFATARDTTVSNKASARKPVKSVAIGIDVRQSQIDNGLTNEPEPPLASIDQRERSVGTNDRQRHTRQSRTRSKVENAGAFQHWRERQRIEYVARDQSWRVCARHQVECRIPTTQQSREQQQPLTLCRLQFDTKFSGAGIELVRFGHADARAFRKCTSNIDSAAGVMPGMREARARLSGRAAFNFCFSSVDRPAIDA